MSVAAERLRDDLFEPGLDVVDRLPGCEAGAVADAEDVGVNRKGLFAEGGIEDNIRSLATDAWQRLQLLAGSRDLALVIVDQRLAKRDDVLRLGIEQADRLDRPAKPLLSEIDHLLRRLDARK